MKGHSGITLLLYSIGEESPFRRVWEANSHTNADIYHKIKAPTLRFNPDISLENVIMLANDRKHEARLEEMLLPTFLFSLYHDTITHSQYCNISSIVKPLWKSLYSENSL